MSTRTALVLALIGLCASAQAAPIAEPVPAAVAAAPKINPPAKALLTQMVAAETALTSYSGTVLMGDPGNVVQVVVKVKKPNDAYVFTTNQGKPAMESVANKVSLTQIDYGQKKYYHGAVSASSQPIQSSLGQSGSILLQMLSDPNQLTQLINAPIIQSLAMGPAGTVGGTATDTVIASLSVGQSLTETVSFEIGQTDHFLYGVAFHVTSPATAGRPAVTENHTETFNDFKANPVLTTADFVFTPPVGLKKVASLQDMQPPMFSPLLKVGGSPFLVHATDMAGHPVSLAQYQGKVLMLDFWATWCGPCRGEIPNVVAAYDKYHARGFDVVGVSLDQPHDKAALTAFLLKHHMVWPQIYDGGFWKSKVAVQYGVQAIPFSVLIGRNGKIAALGPRGPALAPAIQAALAAK